MAKTRRDAGKPIEDEIERMKESLISVLNLKAIKWDCGWNVTHFRGCLEAFQELSKQYPDVLSVLKGNQNLRDGQVFHFAKVGGLMF